MNNINPKLWGPSAWSFLFYIIISYPDNPTIDDKNNMINFFTSMGKILPCEKCRINFSNHLKKFPINDIVLSNRQNLSQWLGSIYNEVRHMNRLSPLTYPQILQKYIEKKDGSDIKINIIFILCMIILLIILIFYLKSKY